MNLEQKIKKINEYCDKNGYYEKIKYAEDDKGYYDPVCTSFEEDLNSKSKKKKMGAIESWIWDIIETAMDKGVHRNVEEAVAELAEELSYRIKRAEKTAETAEAKVSEKLASVTDSKIDQTVKDEIRNRREALEKREKAVAAKEDSLSDLAAAKKKLSLEVEQARAELADLESRVVQQKNTIAFDKANHKANVEKLVNAISRINKMIAAYGEMEKNAAKFVDKELLAYFESQEAGDG